MDQSQVNTLVRATLLVLVIEPFDPILRVKTFHEDVPRPTVAACVVDPDESVGRGDGARVARTNIQVRDVCEGPIGVDLVSSDCRVVVAAEEIFAIRHDGENTCVGVSAADWLVEASGRGCHFSCNVRWHAQASSNAAARVNLAFIVVLLLMLGISAPELPAIRLNAGRNLLGSRGRLPANKNLVDPFARFNTLLTLFADLTIPTSE